MSFLTSYTLLAHITYIWSKIRLRIYTIGLNHLKHLLYFTYLILLYLTLLYLTLPYLTLPYLTLPYLTFSYLLTNLLTYNYVIFIGSCHNEWTDLNVHSWLWSILFVIRTPPSPLADCVVDTCMMWSTIGVLLARRRDLCIRNRVTSTD